MAGTDPILSTAPVTGIAEPHQSTVTGILHAVGQGLFTAAEAAILIDRVRAHVTAVPTTVPIAVPMLVADGLPFASSGHTSNTLPHDPDRTF